MLAVGKTISLTEITDDPLLRTLIQGKERIAQGWCQGTFHDPDTDSYCMAGAVYGHGKDAVGAENYLQQAISRIEGYAFSPDVPNWNDDFDRTHEEVLQAFDKAIELREKWIVWNAERQLALSA